MLSKSFKSRFYKKIMVQTPVNCIKINCRNKPDFQYYLKDTIVNSLTDHYDIEDYFINVASMSHCNNNEKFIDIKCGNESPCFTLKQDFSNILEILNRFNVLVESLYKSFEWKYLQFEIDYRLNHIRCCEHDSSKYVYAYVRSDFVDFDILEKYDFIVIDKPNPSSNNKITFDGRTLEMDKYIIKFINKPGFDKFTINLDSKISNITFDVPYGYYMTEPISHQEPKNNKYDIYFTPNKIEHFSFLRLLNDVSWFKDGFNTYAENDILSRVYDV